MSEEYISQKTKAPRGSKATKPVKVYEPKVTEVKDPRSGEASGQKRANDGFIRQNATYSEDTRYKDAGLGRNSANNKSEHSSRQRRQNFIKFSKKEFLEKHANASQESEELNDLVDKNPQIFVKEKLNPLNIGFKNFDIKNDECFNSKIHTKKTGKESKNFELWDIGAAAGADLLEGLDIKKVDIELRGPKSHKIKAIESALDQEESQNIETQDNSTEEKEKLTGSVHNEEEVDDEGEFSNIDVIFEQKLKSNPKSCSQEEDEEVEETELFKTSRPNSQGEEIDATPIWGSFDAEEIKKNRGSMDSLFVQPEEKSKDYPFSLEGNFDLFLTNPNKREQFIGGGQSQKKTPNKIFPLFYLNEDSYDEHSTDVSLNLTPVNELNWSFNKNTETANPSSYRAQQQQYPIREAQEIMRQAMPKAINLSTCFGNNKFTANNMNQAQVSNGDKKYVPMQNFPGFSKLAMNATPNTNSTNFAEKTSSSKDALFKFFSSGAEYEKKSWYYKDLQNKVRGPFSAKEMDEWYQAKYLPMDLMLTYGDNKNFRSLTELVKYRDSFKTDPSPQKLNAPTKQTQDVNLNNLSSYQLYELTKNPEFIEYARVSGVNLNQLMYSIKQREANEKSMASNKSQLASQGFYPLNNSNSNSGSNLARSAYGTAQQLNNNKSNNVQFGMNAVPEFNYSQGLYNNNNYNNIDSTQSNKRISNQGYPTEFPKQQHTQQSSVNQNYPNSPYMGSPLIQTAPQRTPPTNFNYQGQIGSPTYLATDNYKSFVMPNGASNSSNRFA